ncbi:MAG: hypothetical protein PGN13_05090 [Patulibacter minatonensis]
MSRPATWIDDPSIVPCSDQIATRSRPERFAAYSASSARPSRTSARTPSLGGSQHEAVARRERWKGAGGAAVGQGAGGGVGGEEVGVGVELDRVQLRAEGGAQP